METESLESDGSGTATRGKPGPNNIQSVAKTTGTPKTTVGELGEPPREIKKRYTLCVEVRRVWKTQFWQGKTAERVISSTLL